MPETNSDQQGTDQNSQQTNTDTGGKDYQSLYTNEIENAKSQRQRAQAAEAKIAELEKTNADAEAARLAKRGEYKQLYEEAQAKLESIKPLADEYTEFKKNKKQALLEKLPEEDREQAANLDLKSLEFVVSKVSSNEGASSTSGESTIVGTQSRTRINNDKESFKPSEMHKMSNKEINENWDAYVQAVQAKIAKG